MRRNSTLELGAFAVGWLVLAAVWAAASYILRVPQYLLASPGRVYQYVGENHWELLSAIGVTGTQALTGLFIACALGVLLGALVYYVPYGGRLLLPPLVVLQTTPVIALAPLVTFWFGYTWVAKAVVAAVVAVFPVVMATHSGLSGARPTHVYLYRLAGRREGRIFWDVRIRAAFSPILASMKVAAVFAVIGSIVADFIGGNSGLGFMILKSTYNSKGDLLMASILCSAVLGQVVLVLVEQSIGRWNRRIRA